MRPGVEATRNIEDELEDLDETDRAIERSGKRTEAQEQRIAQLKREDIVSESAEKQLTRSRCTSLVRAHGVGTLICSSGMGRLADLPGSGAGAKLHAALAG